MKVIFITTESMLDHSYTMIKELSGHIELKAYIIAKKNTPELTEFCRELNVSFVERHSFKNPLSFFRERWLLSEVKKQKPDLVWFDRTTFYQTILLKFMLKRFLINVHDVDLHPEEKDYHGIITQKLIFRFFRKNIAVMSKTQSEKFEKIYNFKPKMLQLPVIDYYTEISNTQKQPGKHVGNKIKFFFFGSVMPYKGIEYLIEAASILADRYSNFEVNIYGRISYNKEHLLEKISANDKIHIVNKYIDYKDVSGIFSSNDVIIIPYKQVSQCGPMLIAYSHNVPVITSRLAGFEEYVTDNKSGLMFESTPGLLAEKMEYIINNPGAINEMREFIKNEVHGKFSMESLAEDYVSAFRQAAGIAN
jgi:glycosyltransferase involved in cell wall biosynthesis